MTHTVYLGVGDEWRVRMPSTAERETHQLAADEPVIEVLRWNGTTEIHGTRETLFTSEADTPEAAPSPRLTTIRQIADDLREAIATGRLRPGDPIPTEEQLVVRYGVSRSTVRAALAEIRHLGLVKTVRPKGTVVVDRGEDEPGR